MSSKRFGPGFYAKNVSEGWVFAFTGDDAVWVKTGNLEILDEDHEGVWQLPESSEACAEFCTKYGFTRITSKEAEPHVRAYIYNVIALLHPDSNKEILTTPQSALEFVRTVKNFVLDLNEI